MAVVLFAGCDAQQLDQLFPPSNGQPTANAPAGYQGEYGPPVYGQPNQGQPSPPTAGSQVGYPPPQYGQPGFGQPQQPPLGGQNETIRIASFNIQVFGVSKLGKPEVMNVLAQVVRRFDVVAVQELRATDQTVASQFLQWINADGSRYDVVVGPRLGRTSSKEQYLFLYNTNRVEVDRGSVFTVGDPQDLLHREPLAATFRVRGPPANQAFTFTLVNIHTDPDETKQELDALADAFMAVQQSSSEDDVILLGDLNVDEYKLGRLGQLPNVAPAILGVRTNTLLSKSYDNIVFNQRTTSEYTGQYGVLNLMQEFGLTQEQALAVSDHLPVWAEFSMYEGGSGGPVASRPSR